MFCSFSLPHLPVSSAAASGTCSPVSGFVSGYRLSEDSKEACFVSSCFLDVRASTAGYHHINQVKAGAARAFHFRPFHRCNQKSSLFLVLGPKASSIFSATNFLSVQPLAATPPCKVQRNSCGHRFCAFVLAPSHLLVGCVFVRRLRHPWASYWLCRTAVLRVPRIPRPPIVCDH